MRKVVPFGILVVTDWYLGGDRLVVWCDIATFVLVHVVTNLAVVCLLVVTRVFQVVSASHPLPVLPFSLPPPLPLPLPLPLSLSVKTMLCELALVVTQNDCT